MAPAAERSSAFDLVPLDALPLADHVVGGSGDVASAARRWREDRESALHRDELAQRAQELADAREAGYREGVVDGRAAAEAEGLELLRGLAAKVDDAHAVAAQAAETAVRRSAEELVAAALAICHWALGRAIEQDPQLPLEIAAQALHDAGGVAGAQVYVSPELGTAASRWAARYGARRPEVVEDPALVPGSVVVRSESGGTAEVSLAGLIARAAEALGVTAEHEAQSPSGSDVADAREAVDGADSR